jgi:hypothetical protein
MAETQQKVHGTSDMPTPEVLDYEQVFKVSPIFVNDLKIVLQEVAYADAQPFFEFLKNYDYVLPVAVLNEFLRKLSTLPYKYVNQIFAIITNQELFGKYFELLQLQQQPQQPQQEEPKNETK